MNNAKSLQQLLRGYDNSFDQAMSNGKVQLMR